LLLACNGGFLDVAEHLLEARASANETRKNGFTSALSIAAFYSHHDVCLLRMQPLLREHCATQWEVAALTRVAHSSKRKLT
jgi:transcriptional regulator GlxA family with amidase domain